MKRVLVCGGRDFHDAVLLNRELLGLRPIGLIIHGGARGADRLAGKWARTNRISVVEFNANWKKYGHGAGPIRNQEMLVIAKPDLVVAFPGGRGTADMVKRARMAGVEVIEVSGRPQDAPGTPK